ncbi:MAG TPA: PVC-type heme-binding CxxCH protein [Pirellulales bacterium]|jgi:putative membrane-bound dehydrogenase-like protein|nr:PVC-type heme-binding CxxCH protein [Pirellulales bacterium]
MNRTLALLITAILLQSGCGSAKPPTATPIAAEPPATPTPPAEASANASQSADAETASPASPPATIPSASTPPADEPAAVEPPLTPQAEQATFRLADDALVVELVAAEPEVVSPVAIAWDAAGRMYVAEMEDYPVGPGKGRIRLLEDRDHDGRYETASVFADGISFPTSVLPSRGGLLVAAAPDILFLQDTDDDGTADRREVLLTGFGEGNQQLRVNGLTWGADNWIYGANGRSDGAVRRPQDPPEKAVSIRGRDFRFRPDGSEFQAVTGHSQFGLGRDDWGERFASWNTIALRHALLAPAVLDQNPQLADLACRDIADPADNTRVFAISPAPQTFNAEPTDFYNALCGLTIFRGDGLGPDYVGDPLVCESLRNLVHRRKLVADGPTFVSKRAVADREFLASTDPWFHPVFLTTGPDGALYIADFYRRWVEHPEWLAANPARETIDWREGAAHGRIWRVRGRDVGRDPKDVVPLDRATTSQLVLELSRKNAWRRDTAQRLLVEKHATSAIHDLTSLATSGKVPVGRLNALWTLDGLDALDAKTLETALADAAPQVRRQAVRMAAARIAAPSADLPELRAALLATAADDDAAVRFEVAVAIAALDGPDKDAAVARLAAADRGNRWDALALQLALGPRAWPFLAAQLQARPELLAAPTAEEQTVLENLALLVGRRHDEAESAACLALLVENAAAANPAGVLAILAGLSQGLSESGISLRQMRGEAPPALAAALAEVPKLLERAQHVGLDPNAALAERLRAIAVLAHCGAAADPAELLALLAVDQPPALSSAAADCLARLADAALADRLFADWTDYTTATRRVLESAALRSPVTTTALLAAVEAGTIVPLELDPAVRDLLVRLPDEALRERAIKLLAAAVPADRASVLEEFAGVPQLAADRIHGGRLAAQHCLTCHQIQGRGRRLGPDLSGVGSQPKQQLLVSLLDPSRQVSPDYLAYTLVTTDGQILGGLVANETPHSVTLRRAEGPDEIVPRDRIELLKASGKSLMPDGFEQKLSPQDVADLLDFLGRPDAALLVAPDAAAGK